MSDHPYARPYSPHSKSKAIFKRAWYHVDRVPYPVSLRWLFYRLYQDGIYAKDEYGKFKDLIKYPRKRFYGPWRPNTLVDDTRAPVYRGFGGNNARDWLRGYVSRQGCKLDKWQSQPYYVECWYEARAMHAQFAYYTSGVTLRPFGGDPSLDFRWEIAKDLERWTRRYPGKPIIILYFGDLDDKGEQIPDSVEGDVRDWSEAEFEFIPCGLNYAQVLRYDIPENPKKPGAYQWEAVDDPQAKEIIVGNVERFVDLDAMERIEAQEQRITEQFKKRFESFIEEWPDNDRD